MPGNIEKVYADGAYNSPVNQKYYQDNEISLQLTGMQGFPSRYDLKPDGQDPDNLVVTDTYRYFDEENLRTSLIRQKLWAYSRSMWINFVRIMNYLRK